MTKEIDMEGVGPAIPYINLFESLPGSCILLQTDAPRYTILATTPEYLVQTQTTKEYLVGKGMFEAFPSNPDEPADTGTNDVRASFDYVRLHKEAHQLPLQRYDVAGKDGQLSETYWSAINKPVFSAEGEVIYIVHTAEDVTALLKSERMEEEHQLLQKAYRKIKESEEKYRSLFSSMEQGFCVIEMVFDENNQPVDYHFSEVNPVFERQTGLKDAIGKSVHELVPNLETHWFHLYGKVALTGESIHFTEGSEAMGRWFDVYAFKVGAKESSKVALLFTDITERSKSEKALKLSESNLRNIISQAPVAMAILKGPQFIVELANDLMYELWGKGKEALLGKSIFDGLPEVRHQGYEELLNSVYTTGERFTAQGIAVTLPRKDNVETVYINLLYEAFREHDGNISGVMAVASDVTEQVSARMKVEASHKEFQFVTDFMPQLIWVTRSDGFHYYYNKQWYDYTGLTPGETEGEGWSQVFHPDDREKAWQYWRHSLQTGEPYEIEYRCRRFDGVYRWFLGRALPLKDETGRVLKWFGTCTDIDDQKSAGEIMEKQVEARTWELKQVNAQLNQFAYSASHDLQEPLRKISYFLERLLKNLGNTLSNDNRRLVERITHTANRMRNLIDDLLNYSNTTLGDTGFAEVELEELVHGVLEDLEATIIENQAEVNIQPLPKVQGDARQLRQLFQNLLSNSIKYCNKGVVPVIQIKSQIVNGTTIQAYIPAEFKSNHFYQIAVTDNGIGFDPHYAEQIFRLFHRLHGKSEYNGTGVGLAIVHKVVENHRGYIWADSSPGAGATFNVLLPVGF